MANPIEDSQVLFKNKFGKVLFGIFSDGWFIEPSLSTWNQDEVSEWAYIEDAFDAFRLQSVRNYIPPSALDTCTRSATAGSGGYATIGEDPEAPLPCPLCGEEVLSFPINSPDGTVQWITFRHGPETPCGISFISDAKDAVTKWNTRTNR